MPRPTQRPRRQPGYLHHKPSNQAYVRLDGRCHYLGVYGCPESHRRYASLIADHHAGESIAASARTRARPLTVGELAEQYLDREAQRFGPRNKMIFRISAVRSRIAFRGKGSALLLRQESTDNDRSQPAGHLWIRHSPDLVSSVKTAPTGDDFLQGQESKMQASIRIVLLLAAIALLGFGQDLHAQTPPARTALDDYIARPDASYGWKVVSERLENGLKLVTVDLTSQTWRTAEEVNRPEWKHWLTVAIPDELESDIGFQMIGSGSNRRNRVPDGPSKMIQDLARQTSTVVAELAMVPNQPLIFYGDGDKRSEDDLIGYTWDQFLKTGDPTWPAQLPMAKSAVRAMDTITAPMASKVGGERTVDRFVLAGASKRGWTTWLAGLDDRVVAIVPIVIDVLNTKPSMLHHFAAYGFWSPAVGNYVQHRIMQRMSDPKGDDLFGLVDPYNYRHRPAKPKYIVNAAGDQFFVLDSSQFYYGDLEGEKHLRYVPNAGHSLRNTDAIFGILGYYQSVLAGQDRPGMK
ncbi:PhoPQ-activated pathogenicity-related family protein [bacterium]|nr:PhoPQ-activated pathogenicity-related family protein [bacterium]